MNDDRVIGIDIAKNYMQIHIESSNRKVSLKKRVKRDNFLNKIDNIDTCLVGMEACGGAHHWAKELIKLGFEVKLMAPHAVKKYASHQKNVANWDCQIYQYFL